MHSKITNLREMSPRNNEHVHDIRKGAKNICVQYDPLLIKYANTQRA